eukprot:scaffold2261_cov405-Prasinococcus_capsulatus_cf.AAC.29
MQAPRPHVVLCCARAEGRASGGPLRKHHVAAAAATPCEARPDWIARAVGVRRAECTILHAEVGTSARTSPRQRQQTSAAPGGSRPWGSRQRVRACALARHPAAGRSDLGDSAARW